MKRRTYKESKSIAGRQLNLMALPGIVHVLIFNYLPMVGLILAFKKFNPNLGIFRSEWVGLANFRFFFMSKDFGMLMRNTLAYAFWFLLVDNFFAILLAVLFYYVRNQKALKYFQTTCILPVFMSMVLISYIVYIFLNPANGLMTQLITSLGGKKINWYTEAAYWPGILTIVRIWSNVGYGSLIYYATMVGIDESLFEAAKMDGAGKWKQIVHIIIPEIMSLLCMKLIMGVGYALGGDFGLFYQVPRNVGALYETTDIFNTYVFRALKTGNSMGRTTAVGLFQSLAGTILLLLVNGIIKKIDDEKSMF